MEGRTGARASKRDTERGKDEEKGTDDRVRDMLEDATEGGRRLGVMIGTGQGQR